MSSYYSKEIMEHFLHPKHLGEIKNADGVGDTKNLRCGDIMRLYVKVGKKSGKEFIRDIKFTTLGCGTAIAATDMICDLAIGKALGQVKKINYNQVLKKLGEVPPQKIHCAHLAEKALKMAVSDYEKKSKFPKIKNQ